MCECERARVCTMDYMYGVMLEMRRRVFCFAEYCCRFSQIDFTIVQSIRGLYDKIRFQAHIIIILNRNFSSGLSLPKAHITQMFLLLPLLPRVCLCAYVVNNNWIRNNIDNIHKLSNLIGFHNSFELSPLRSFYAEFPYFFFRFFSWWRWH